MSSPESSPGRRRNRLAGTAALLVALATVAAGCTVRPLYGDVTTSATGPVGASAAALASVSVNEARSEQGYELVAQELRNQLIFLLGGGQGNPTSPRYALDLDVKVLDTTAAAVQTTARDDEPSTAVATLRATYRLSDMATGEPVATGLRMATAPYDLSRQEFASLRAQRDARNRAAREAAEQIRLAIAQEMERPSGGTVPAVISVRDEIPDLAD
jgi:LPS-assembly lipoprotein